MRISTRGRYGLRVMLELARHFGDTPVLVGALAEVGGFSGRYLYAQLAALKAVGLARSVRDAGGSFSPSRAPSEIKLSLTLQSVEGWLPPVDRVTDRRACDRPARCAARRM